MPGLEKLYAQVNTALEKSNQLAQQELEESVEIWELKHLTNNDRKNF